MSCYRGKLKTMIIQWILFIFLIIFNFFVWIYFYFFAPINYHNKISLTLVRIGAALYYFFTFGYQFYMARLRAIHFDPHQNKILSTFINWVFVVNSILIIFFLVCLIPPSKR